MLTPSVQIDGRRVRLDLMYPNVEPNPNEVEVGMCCTRAADSILIRYDFRRNGWSILQASTFEWDGDDPECDPDWQEVAFVEAWARERRPTWEDTA